MPIKGNDAIDIDVQVMTSSGEYVTLKRLTSIELEPTADEEIRQYVKDEILSGEVTIDISRHQALKWAGFLSRAEAKCTKKKKRKLQRIKRRLHRHMIRIMKDVERGKYGIF